MPPDKISFIDATIRDGQETLLGGRLRIEMVSPILETLDSVGFRAIEAWGGGAFLSSLTRLHQDPWERLRILGKSLKRTPLQILLRGRFLVGDRPYPSSFIDRFLKRASELGAKTVRLFDPLNDLNELAPMLRAAQRHDLEVQVAVLCSNRNYTSEYYRKAALKARDYECEALGLFDPIGGISAQRAGELSALFRRVSGHDVFVHLHSLEGAGLAATAEACRRGACIVDTCFSAFAEAGSLPSIEATARTLKEEGRVSVFDPAALIEVSRFFRNLRHWCYEKVPSVMRPATFAEEAFQDLKADVAPMILMRSGERRLPPERAGGREISRMMDELGLVTLVAPITEIVSQQALLNLQLKERYSTVTDEFLRLIRGHFGQVQAPASLRAYADETGPEFDGGKGGIDERLAQPPTRDAASEEDLLTFNLYPQAWGSLNHVERTLRISGIERVAASVLATISEAEEESSGPSPGIQAAEPATRNSRWRSTIDFSTSSTLRQRGFFEEPF